MSIDLIIGWVLGLLGSLITGIVMYWLEGRREERRERFKQQGEQILNSSQKLSRSISGGN